MRQFTATTGPLLATLLTVAVAVAFLYSTGHAPVIPSLPF